MVFVNLTEAFDTVNREALKKMLSKVGFPYKMVSVIVSLHKGMTATVTSSNQCSETLFVATGTNQGCALTLVRFSIFFQRCSKIL